MKILITLSIIASLAFQLYGQQQPKAFGKISPAYSGYGFTLEPQTSYSWKFAQSFTSVSFTLSPSQDLKGAFLISEKDTFFLSTDSHSSQDTVLLTNLIVFNKAVDNLKFHSGNIEGAIKIHLHKVATLDPVKKKDQKRLNAREDIDNCSAPTTIPPSIWREGLTPPPLLPEKTDVKHIIIHHSAGSNNNTNYVEVVRNIYVFHTSPVSMGGRGYNDIGYNFLIAADGTIFQGRDDQGLAEKDNILGAHMCAKNRNTIGICLLGTFIDVMPTQATFNSLYDLVSWKAHKENIDPFGKLGHPFEKPGRPLQNIAGHRQGCGVNDTSAANQSYTECPGDSVAYFLPAIRAEVFRRINLCTLNGTLGENHKHLSLTTYPNPSVGHFTLELQTVPATIKILDVHGRLYQTITSESISTKVQTKDLSPGIYIIEVIQSEMGSVFLIQSVMDN
ncbi:MAG TPA: N-acetylmuramoyl-L-alanine amidase [Cytophagaceae bacterium]|jgi:hypothetical protein